MTCSSDLPFSVNLTIGTTLGIDVRTADLLDALNAVPDDSWADWKNRAETQAKMTMAYAKLADEHKAEAERLQGIVDAVDELLGWLRDQPTPERVEAAIILRSVQGRIDAALNPAPAFELPTQVPARIEAKDYRGRTVELNLWTDGKELSWCDDDEGSYTPEDVMNPTEFTDHRLIEEDDK